MVDKNTAVTYIGAVAIVGAAYVFGWVEGRRRGMQEAIQTESGAVGLEPIPESIFPAWVEPVSTVILIFTLGVIIFYGVQGGFPRVR